MYWKTKLSGSRNKICLKIIASALVIIILATVATVINYLNQFKYKSIFLPEGEYKISGFKAKDLQYATILDSKTGELMLLNTDAEEPEIMHTGIVGARSVCCIEEKGLLYVAAVTDKDSLAFYSVTDGIVNQVPYECKLNDCIMFSSGCWSDAVLLCKSRVIFPEYNGSWSFSNQVMLPIELNVDEINEVQSSGELLAVMMKNNDLYLMPYSAPEFIKKVENVVDICETGDNTVFVLDEGSNISFYNFYNEESVLEARTVDKNEPSISKIIPYNGYIKVSVDGEIISKIRSCYRFETYWDEIKLVNDISHIDDIITWSHSNNLLIVKDSRLIIIR